MNVNNIGGNENCSILDNPRKLLEKIKLQPQGIYSSEGDIHYWEYLTRFKDIAGTVVADCFAILEKNENSFQWYASVVNEVVKKIISKEQLNPLSINTFPHDIIDDNFIEKTKELISITPPEQSIILEVIEKYFGGDDTDKKKISDRLIELQSYGLKIAIDDLYITHESIEDIPSQGMENLYTLLDNGCVPDIIKIDGGKIISLYKNKDNHKYKRLIEEYKKLLKEISDILIEKGKKPIIVAEWVNTDEEIEFCTSLGCNGFQGFELEKLFSKQKK